jgi:hypothetical protein
MTLVFVPVAQFHVVVIHEDDKVACQGTRAAEVEP